MGIIIRKGSSYVLAPSPIEQPPIRSEDLGKHSNDKSDSDSSLTSAIVTPTTISALPRHELDIQELYTEVQQLREG